MADVIKIDELVAGDVLLYKGTGFISRAIQFFDGTDFSHAALYLGDGMVGEAVATGLERRNYEAGATGIWVQAHRLKDIVPTMDPVLDVGNAYLDQGNRYGYEQLLLLAFLCLTRKLKFAPSLRDLVRRVLDAAAAVLTRMLSEGREPMICSEFVYRVYDEAIPGPDDVYSLWINRLPMPAVGLTRAVPAAAEGPAAPTAVRGQGIHPQSLLAFMESSSGSAWVGSPLEGLPVRGEPEGTLEELESCVETYLEEVRVAPGVAVRAPTQPEPTLEDLRAATNGFAASLYAATHPEDAEARAMLTPAAVATVSEYLTRTAADFVTPADLYKTQSLFLVGKIEEV